ncbi:MAG: hypothetical protein AB1595_07650 [bacterium]
MSKFKQTANLTREAKDRIDIYPSQETITSPGALRFKDIEIIPSINLSSSELANIPDLISSSASSNPTPSLDPSLVSPPWYEPYDLEENLQSKTPSPESRVPNPESLEGRFIKFQDYVFYVMIMYSM